MANRYGKNFTGFQNITLKGSSVSAPVNQGMIEMGAGATNAPTTISIDMISGSTAGSILGSVEQPYFHIEGAGISLGTGFFRMTNVGASPYGTLRIRSSTYFDTDTAWQLPAKSGIFAVAGTFTVNLPAITGGNWGETSVTVTGIRTEDALVVTLQDTFNTVTTDRPMAFLAGARPANGGIHLTFMNPSATATIYNDLICGYAAAR